VAVLERRLAAVFAVGFAVYAAVRWLGLLGVAVVYFDVVASAAALAGLVLADVAAGGVWGRRRGLELALLGSAGLLGVFASMGLATGFAVNGLLARHWVSLGLLWVIAVAAASAAAGGLLGLRWGAALAASLGFLGFSSLRGLLYALTRGSLWGLLAPSLASMGLAAAAGVLGALYSPLAGLVYGVLAGAVPAYLLPLLPDLPGSALSLIAAAVHVVVVVAALGARYVVSLREAAQPSSVRGLAAVTAVALLVAVFMKRGYYVAVVATGSMRPTIEPGDLVVIAPVSPEDLRPGMIVAYVGYDDSLVVHRLIEVRETPGGMVIVTRGDANPAPDPPFPASRLAGRVAAVVPKLGLPQLFLAERLGSVVAFPALLTMIAAVVAAVSAAKRGNSVPL
jgi:signal peptidase